MVSTKNEEQPPFSGVATHHDDADLPEKGPGSSEGYDLNALGYEAELHRNRSTLTLLFQSLAIAAVPYGFGAPIISSIYGGGQLSMFLGWTMVLIADESIALSLAELASKFPTSAGPYYWSFQVAPPRMRTFVSYITGWAWLVGNWTITLSINFGFASVLQGTVAIYYPNFSWDPWQLLLIFYAICFLTFFIVSFGNRFLPSVDTACAVFTLVTIFITLVCLSVKAGVGRHSAADTLGYYDPTLSGWGDFSFLIGTLPGAYTFSALGMVSSMAEECRDPTRKLPKALVYCVPVGGIAGYFFIIPLCATLPPLTQILDAPVGQILPYTYKLVMQSQAAAAGLTVLVLIITFFASISITVAASRTTWAFARDKAVPLSSVWSRVDERRGIPVLAVALVTLIQLLLGLINLGSTSAFNAFISVGVIALAVSYGIPIAFLMGQRRKSVQGANWSLGPVFGWASNILALAWIMFETVLFSMPTALPATPASMNYASVVFVGFLAISLVWYAVHGRKVYKGPPESDGLAQG